MADIINSQKANVPKSFARPRQPAAKPVLQSTFTISRNPVSSTASRASNKEARASTGKSVASGRDNAASKDSVISHPKGSNCVVCVLLLLFFC